MGSNRAIAQKYRKQQVSSAPIISNNRQHSSGQASPRKYGPPPSWSAALTLSAAATKETEFMPELVSHLNLPGGAVCGVGYHERARRCNQADRRADRRTGGQTDRQTERPADRQTARPTDRQTGDTQPASQPASQPDKQTDRQDRQTRQTDKTDKADKADR